MKAKAKVIVSDCVAAMKKCPDNSVEAIVCDPPYDLLTGSRNGSRRINKEPSKNPYSRHDRGNDMSKGGGFMGMAWDATGIAFDPATWAEALRILRPGGHLLALGGTRTYHKLVTAIEDAGFEIRDCLTWHYGCLSEDTEILVNGEWESYHKAVQGKLTLCFDPDTQTLIWAPIQELFVYDYADTAYRIQSKHTDQIVTKNHQCLVYRDGRFELELAYVAAWQSDPVKVPVLAMHIHENVRDYTPSFMEEAIYPEEVVFDAFLLEAKVWCVRTPTGAFVARRNGRVFVTGNSGFPKSSSVSKTLDRMAGLDREDKFEDSFTRRAGPSGNKRCEVCGKWLVSGTPCQCPRPQDLPQTDLAKRWSGWGSALKPSVELIVHARKPFTVVPFDNTILAETENLIGVVLCQLLLSVNSAEFLSQSSLVVLEKEYVSAHMLAVVRHGERSVAWCEKMATFNSPETVSMCLSIVRSWSSILDVLWNPTNRSTTSTASGLTIVLRTLNSCLSGIIPDFMVKFGTTPFGHLLNALPVAGTLKEISTYFVITPTHIAAVFALLRQELGFVSGVESSFMAAARSADSVLSSVLIELLTKGDESPKSSVELICLARKPLIGTIAENVIQYQTGALNIDGTRIGPNPGYSYNADKNGTTFHGPQGDRIPYSADKKGSETIDSTKGRWPANTLLSHSPNCLSVVVESKDQWECVEGCPVAELDRQSGVSGTGKFKPRSQTRSAPILNIEDGWNTNSLNPNGGKAPDDFGDVGGASRFFLTTSYESELDDLPIYDESFVRFMYTAKASRRERSEGLSPESEPNLRLRSDLTDEQRTFIMLRLQELGLLEVTAS